MSRENWCQFPKENVLYCLDVTFFNSESTNIDKQYSIVHYAAYFHQGQWVNANSFESINVANAYQIDYRAWYDEK